MKTGILLLNFGGPGTLDEVKPFLYRLFTDPDILAGVPRGFRHALAFFISTVKGPGSKKSYALIGGGSPQLKWTQVQAEGLQKILETESPGQFKVAVGMRAWAPLIPQAIQELRDWGAEELVLFPLFPQFSKTTTGSCFKEVYRSLKEKGWAPAIREITHWPDHPHYSGLLRKTLEEAVVEAERDAGAGPLHIMFTAHSLPMKVIRSGDYYPEDVARTVASVIKGIQYPWSLSFQSRNGPVPWLKPYTETEILRLAAAGVKRLVVVPVSFVSDHIETLFELDMLYLDEAKSAGITHYYRARSFNGDPQFFDVLRAVLKTSGL